MNAYLEAYPSLWSLLVTIHRYSEEVISLRAAHLRAIDFRTMSLKQRGMISEKMKLCCFCAMEKPSIFVVLVFQKCEKIVKNVLVSAIESPKNQ